MILTAHNRHRGIGLLELMLSLAIIAILLIMATRYFAQARSSQMVVGGIQQVSGITAAARSYFSATGSAASSLDDLVTKGYIAASEKTNPWGGTNSLTGSGGGAISITMEGVTPNTDCERLASQLTALAQDPASPPSCSGTTLTGTF